MFYGILMGVFYEHKQKGKAKCDDDIPNDYVSCNSKENMKKVRGMKDIENFNDENKFHIKHWT
jgi:hypothetical protein